MALRNQSQDVRHQSQYLGQLQLFHLRPTLQMRVCQRQLLHHGQLWHDAMKEKNLPHAQFHASLQMGQLDHQVNRSVLAAGFAQ